MSETRTQSWQVRTDKDLKNLGKLKETNYVSVLDAVDSELDYPLKLSASFPTADAKLNFGNSLLTQADGAKKVLPPVKKQVFSLSANPFINFQTQAVSAAGDFDIVWPASTVGQFRRVGFTLIGSGKIKALFSAEVALEANLPNPGTLMVNGGLPLGYVDLVCTNVAGYFKTIGSVTDIIENAKIYRFGSGAGGGSGTGDANSFDLYLSQRLNESFFKYANSNVFEIDESNQIESATATYDLVDGVYSFSAAGQNFISKQLFGDEFLANSDEARKVEIHALFLDNASLDEMAVFEASLDGVNYETVPMSREGLTPKMSGSLHLAQPANTLLSSASNDGMNSLTDASLHGQASRLTVVGKKAIREIQVGIQKDGNPSGTFFVKIMSGASLPTSELYVKAFSVAELSSGLNLLTLSGFKTILPGGTYWIVVETDATYRASYVAGTHRIRVGRGTSSGNQNAIKTATGWEAYDHPIFHTVNGQVYDLRLKMTSSAGGKKLKAFGVLYDESVAAVTGKGKPYQKFTFLGTENKTLFPITNFTPHPDYLIALDPGTSQVYRYPFFKLDGQNVTFPSGTFQSTTENFELQFLQLEGGGYDHSDENAAIITANGLGSTDPSLNKAVPGQNLIQCREDGVLVRLKIFADNSFTWVEV